ncbi:hypothetical protein C7E25_16385, partial [Stenotrophomonas maltophilia]
CGPDGFVAAARERLTHQVAGFQAEAFTPPAHCGWPAMTRRWRSAMCWPAVRMASLPLRVNA